MKSEILNIIETIVITIGMAIFTGVVMILNNIEEFVEWLEKRINKR